MIRYTQLYKSFVTCMSITLVLLFALVSCQSSEQEPTPKEEILQKERPLPESVFFEASETNMSTSDKALIENYALKLGIDSPLVEKEVRDVSISLSTDGRMVVIINTEETNFRKKHLLMRVVGAKQRDSDKNHWIYTSEEGESFYIDVSYENALVITDYNTMDASKEWGWMPPKDLVEDEELVGWIWNAGNTLLGGNTLAGFQITWIGMKIHRYQEEEKRFFASILIAYAGDESTRTTIKLLLPFFVKGIMQVEEFATLPNVVIGSDLIFIEKTYLDEAMLYGMIE